MKTLNLTHLLMLGLVLALASSGCRKHPQGYTAIPENTYSGPKDQPPADLDTGMPVTPQEPVTQEQVGIPTADKEIFEGMLADRQALAGHAVHFGFDSAMVGKDQKVHVEAAVAALRLDSTAKLLVEGHCDERGTEEYNRALGERRALAVREAMAKLGIDPNRVRTLSFGEDKPADPGHDEAAWKQNRRAELVLLHPQP